MARTEGAGTVRYVTKVQPQPPRDVRLVTPDGDEIPVECRYDGEVDGIHQWVAVSPAGVTVRPGMALRVAVFPPRTSISVEVAP